MDSRYIPMTEADCRQTCATLRQMLTTRTKEITELKAEVEKLKGQLDTSADAYGLLSVDNSRLREREKELTALLKEAGDTFPDRFPNMKQRIQSLLSKQ